MKNKILVVVFGLLTTFGVAQTQSNYVFRVMANSGANEIMSGDSWKPLKTLSNLNDQDVIKLGANSYVGLVHISGRSRELKEEGSYKIKDLASAMTSGSSVLNKYVDFILSKNSEEAKKNRLIVTGSVHRSSFKEDIIVYLPENTRANLFNTRVVVNWESKSESKGPYILKVQNMLNQDLIVTETAGTSYSLDFASPELKNDMYFLVQIINKNSANLNSDQYLIKKLQKGEQQEMKIKFDEFTKELPEETALNKFILAGFYESHELFIDAITAYEDAIKLAPGVSTYKEAYDEFLYRNRLKFPEP